MPQMFKGEREPLIFAADNLRNQRSTLRDGRDMLNHRRNVAEPYLAVFRHDLDLSNG